MYKGVEKNNDDVRKFHLTKSNKWDAPKDILLVSKRLQFTSQLEREPRAYTKRNGEYWSTEIKEANEESCLTPHAQNRKLTIQKVF